MNPLKLLLDYKLTDTAILVMAFGSVVLHEIPLADVEAIYHGFPLFVRHVFWLNRLDLWDSAVTVRLRSGKRRHIVLTPEQPEPFVATVRSLLRRRG